MTVEENVLLKTITTLRVGGPARAVAHCTTVDDIREALAYARERHLPFYPLGEGSNVLAHDEGYAGVVLQIALPGLTFETQPDDTTLMSAGAGVSWDEAVEAAAERGLWGIENLAGIPGFMGAAPVQNIGAYGMELKDTFAYADVIDTATNEVHRLTREECAFGYRDSRFKHEPNLIITSVTLRLKSEGTPKIEYGDLQRARDEGVDLTTPRAIGIAVRAIRSHKFPDRTQFGTAGSFFKNPVISESAYAKLAERYGTVPRFPNPNGVKIPLAFVLDKVLGLRGHRKGPAWLFGAQPLVLVVDADGEAKDVEALATEIETRVKEATDITIEREVRSMPCA